MRTCRGRGKGPNHARMKPLLLRRQPLSLCTWAAFGGTGGEALGSQAGGYDDALLVGQPCERLENTPKKPWPSCHGRESLHEMTE